MSLIFSGSSRHIKKLLLLLSFFYLPVVYAKTDPSFSWRTLSSAHFLVHYHQGEEALAQRALAIAEDVHTRLVPRLKSQPHDRTHIVLVDARDDANGSATPLPYNLIKLYITQPFGESVFGAMNYDDWMRLLITHEYTHIVHLDMVNSLPAVLDSIFGNLYFPNMFEPVWLIEGLAVYEETELTGGGRNRSPAADMVLRMAMLENNFPPISHAANYTEKWPGGKVPYLFGGGFTAFIARKYGREKLADLSLDYSGRWWPFLVNGTARRVLGSDYDELWAEWKSELASRYEADKQKVLVQGLSVTRALTQRGDMTLAPAISPDGKQIAYYAQDEDEHPAIRLMNLDGSADRKLLNNTASSAYSISWRADGKGFYYTRIERVRNTNLYNDIYYYDLEQRKETRLSRKLRARDPFPSPDGSRLIFVTNRLGKTRLATMPLLPDAISNKAACAEDVGWLNAESELQFESPRYSPDGQKIVVGVRQPDGYKDIWILDNQGNKLAELMHDRAIDGGAVWSADGRSIYFSSDRSGIFNLYAYDLDRKQISRVSNVLGGAFMPSVTRDGSMIAFANYTSQGFDIYAMDNRNIARQVVSEYRDPYPAMKYDEKPVDAEQNPYNPWPTLYPHLWLPNFGYSSYSGSLAGLFTLGADAIERHSYTLSALYGSAQQRTWYDFNYRYDGLYPSLKMRARDIDMGYANLLVQQAGFVARSGYVERSRMLNASLTFPLLKLDRQHALSLGYQRKNVSALTSLPPWNGYDGAVPAQGVLASGRASYLFNNAKTYGYSISPEDGRNVEFGYEQMDHRFGSDFDLKKYSVDWHEYVDLPYQHHVLLLRGYAGKSTGEVIAQRAFQLGGDMPGEMTISIDDNNVYLRGYPLNQYRGQNVGLASMEYRFPLQNIELGDGNRPFFFKRLHGAVFAEAGNAWDGAFDRKDVKRSVGAEARMDMTLSYFLPVTLRMGFFKALGDQRDKMISISIWATLL
ncbi:MAG: PD40 domain-containing protein [Nitrosomonadales bacterium]|nr:PD40 domain-containing protein [Nitrosomonadales bacterium]